MAFVFHCPLCTSTLKTGAPVPAGRSIQCPKCHHLFTTTETTVQEEDPGTFPQAHEAPPAPADIPLPRSAPVEDRLPSERRDERERAPRRDEFDHPRRRSRYDDDYADRDRPRSRSRYDEEAPRRRRRYEDEDDRPRRRSRYDDDDRPRRPARRGSNRTAWIVVLLIIGLFVALIVMVGRMMDDDQDVPFKAFAPGVDAEMLALAPHDSVILAGVDVNELRKDGRFARLIGDTVMNRLPDRQAVQRKIDQAGLNEHDLSGVLVAMSAPGGSGPVIVLRFNKDIDHDQVVDAFNAKHETDGFKRYYTSGAAGGSGFFFAGKRLLVIADNRTTLKKLLHHDRNQIQLPQDLRDLAAKAAGSYWLVIKKDGGPAAMQGLGAGFGADDFFADFADQTDAILVNIAAQNGQLDCELGLHSKGKKAADEIAQQMQAEINAVRQVGVNNHPHFRALPPNEKALAQAVVQSATFRSDGSVAFMKYRVTIGMFENLMQMQQNGRFNRPPFMQK